MRVITIDKTLVAYINGKQYSKEIEGSSEDLLLAYQKLGNSTDSEALEFFKAPETTHEQQLRLEFEQKQEEAKAFEDILDFMKDVRDNGHELFEVKNNSIYLKGINISMPELLVREIIKVDSELNQNIVEGDLASEYEAEERLNSLINFWSLCAMNPDPRARHDLFKFLQNHNLNLTTSGNFVAYRTVREFKTTDRKLEEFITQEWMKVKRWKKSPKNYLVIHDNSVDEYKVVKNDSDYADNFYEVGNLDELYQNVSEITGNVYTDAHTGSTRIKIGEPVVMDREEVDPDPTHSCSTGYHAGNQTFMKNNMGYFGNVGVVVLINPRNVTSVPTHDSGKLRTCSYLPIALAETDENGYIKDIEVDVFDYELAENTQEELELMSRMDSTELEEYKKHEFIAPELDFESVKNIRENIELSLEEANEIVNNRKI